jgi:hypothetical protein
MWWQNRHKNVPKKSNKRVPKPSKNKGLGKSIRYTIIFFHCKIFLAMIFIVRKFKAFRKSLYRDP